MVCDDFYPTTCVFSIPEPIKARGKKINTQLLDKIHIPVLSQIMRDFIILYQCSEWNIIEYIREMKRKI